MSEGVLGFLDALRRQWLAVLLVFVPLVAGAAYYTSTLPDEYEAVAVVGFSPRAERTPSADVVRLLLPKYEVFVTSAATVDRVAEELDVDAQRLSKRVDPTIPAETATLRIAVRSRSASLASDAVNAFADQAVDFSAFDPVIEASVVAPSVPPTEPTGPPRRMLIAASVAVALLAATGTALALERLRPRVRSISDISLHSDLRVLGRIPKRRSMRENPLTALADQVIGSAVRATRTTIDRESRDRPVHVLAVTSALASEGKTTFAGVLAVALSRLDARVLLVDADLIRPQLARRFDIEDDDGLSAVLRHDATLQDAVAKVSPTLHVLPTRTEPDAGDLLVRRLPEVLADARAEYDIVIVDAPPLLGNDLTGTIAALADGTVLVVGRGTSASAVRQAASMLSSLALRTLGAVANGFPSPVETYYVGR